MYAFGYKKLTKQPYREPFRIKVVFLGDHGCGKTCLLLSCCIGTYKPDSYVPCVFQSFIADLIVDNVEMEIIPWDDCDRNVECKVPLRALIYQDIDVIALCFSIDSQFSLQNVETRWLAEMKHFCVNVPTILIGNKKDLRDQQNMNVAASSIENGKTDVFVMFEQGKEMAERIGALYYLECSAKTMDGINLVLPTAGSVALQTFQPKRRPKCVLL